MQSRGTPAGAQRYYVIKQTPHQPNVWTLRRELPLRAQLIYHRLNISKVMRGHGCGNNIYDGKYCDFESDAKSTVPVRKVPYLQYITRWKLSD